mmetsp:Transcript_48431/g.90770  ORF Transcript_48431/g.90770 Transcript_48431/m.90770 type:complete len:287 (+) Transcript_48431:71-931(+)
MASYAPVVEAEHLIDLERVVGPLSSESDSDQEPSRWPRRLFLPALSLGGLCLVCIFAVVASGGADYFRADVEAMQQKAGMYRPGGMPEVPQEPEVSGVDPRLINSVNDLTGGKEHIPSLLRDPLARPEDLTDGNLCANDEELLGKLCYKKCSLLTHGEAPIRLSAFSCGKSRGFQDFFGAKVGTLIPCEGYDVSGDEAGEGCPHKAGTCLVNEEFSLGKCYKRCSDLTDGQFPYRTSAETCCKTKNLLECIEPSQSRFSFSFNVGGGNGPEAKSHSPDVRYTELGH